MYLYEKQKDKVEIYSLVPNMDKICEYRKVCIETIPEEERVLKAVCRNNMVLSNGKLVNVNGYINNRITSVPSCKLNKSSGWFMSDYHYLLSYERVGCEVAREKELIDGFCNGDIKANELVLVTKRNGLDNLNGLLLTSYYNTRCDQECVMSNIISMPMELFSLEWCMLGGNMDALDDGEFSKIIKLFDFSTQPVDIFSYEDVIKYKDYGLIDESKKMIVAKIDDYSLKSEKTLTRVRKYR